MSYLDHSEEEIHDVVERYGLTDDMFFDLHKHALKRIKELEESLRWYIETDEVNECEPENQYWTDGKHDTMKLLGMEVE